MQAITEGLIYISYKDITFYHNKHSLSKTQGNNQDDKMVESVCVHAHECNWTVMGPYMCLLWHVSIAIFFFKWASSKDGQAAFLNLSGGWAKCKIHIWLTKEIFLFTHFPPHWYEKHTNSFDAVL